MKIMIASDIHGSAYYCNKMLEAYKREKADKLLLLGDVLYHGPRNDLPREYEPKRVIEMLNQVKEEILCVRGNCDTEVDQMVLEFPVLAEYCILYWEDRMVFATHGHKFNPSNLPMLKKGDILLNGHTHIPAFEKQDEIYYVNPGSVSIPKEGSAHGYIILENNFTFKSLEGEVYRQEEIPE
jgi:putative phosphoesterase